MELPPENPKIPHGIDVESQIGRRNSKFVLPLYINPEIAYLAGALRDGCISATSTPIGTKQYVAFCNSSYEWLNEVVKVLIEKIFSTKISKPFCDRKNFQIRIRKHGVVSFLSRLFGHPGGKQTKWKTPSWIKTAPAEIKKWYIRGFFDSEGGCGNVKIQKSKYPWQSMFPISFYLSSDTGSNNPLADVREILKTDFGIVSQNLRKDRRIRWTGKYSNKKMPYYFRITAPESKVQFIECIGSSHPSKHENLSYLFELIAGRS